MKIPCGYNMTKTSIHAALLKNERHHYSVRTTPSNKLVELIKRMTASILLVEINYSMKVLITYKSQR